MTLKLNLVQYQRHFDARPRVVTRGDARYRYVVTNEHRGLLM